MAFAAGSMMAILGRHLLVARRPTPFGPSAIAAVGFAVWFWLSVTWMVFQAPDWMLCYFVPAEQVHLPALHGLFGLSLVLSALSGHTLTAIFVQRGQMRSATTVLLAGVALWLGLWVMSFDRYLVHGDAASWLAGTGIPLPESDIAPAMNIIGIADALGFVIPAVWLVRAGRRLRAT